MEYLTPVSFLMESASGEIVNKYPWSAQKYLWGFWCELPRRKRMRWVPPETSWVFILRNTPFNIIVKDLEITSTSWIPVHFWQSWGCHFLHLHRDKTCIKVIILFVIWFFENDKSVCFDEGSLWGGGSASKSWGEARCWCLRKIECKRIFSF